MRTSKRKICLMSSEAATLWSFYRALPKRIESEGFEVFICSSKSPELRLFANEGFETCDIPISRKISPLKDVLSIHRLVRFFKQEGFDLIHAHTPKAGLLGMIAGKLSGVRNGIYTCHGLPHETERGLKKWILRVCERITFALATNVLVVSKSLLYKVRKYGIYGGCKIGVLLEGSACGVDLVRFTNNDDIGRKGKAIRDALNVGRDDVLIGFIGRLVPDKGIGILLDTFSELREEISHVHLIVIGNYEPHRGVLNDKHIRMLCDHDRVTHLGYIREIEGYYAAMDMVVLPSRREGFPYALLEASAMGLATVASRVTGCVDAVVDGETGLLVSGGDIAHLKAAMKRLIEDRPLRKRMGLMGRKIVEDKFSQEYLLDGHIKVYKSVLGD